MSRLNQPPTPRGSVRRVEGAAIRAFHWSRQGAVLDASTAAPDETHVFARDPLTGEMTIVERALVAPARVVTLGRQFLYRQIPELAALVPEPVEVTHDVAEDAPEPVTVTLASINSTPLVGPVIVGDTPSWLDASLAGNDLTLAFDVTGLPLGTYEASVRIDSRSAAPAYQEVTLSVSFGGVALGALTFARTSVAVETRRIPVPLVFARASAATETREV